MEAMKVIGELLLQLMRCLIHSLLSPKQFLYGYVVFVFTRSYISIAAFFFNFQEFSGHEQTRRGRKERLTPYTVCEVLNKKENNAIYGTNCTYQFQNKRTLILTL